MKRIIQTDKAPQAVGPYSQAVMKDNILYISGQIALDPETGIMIEGGISAQTKQVFANIAAILESAGMDLGNILKTTVYLDDINDFSEMNKVYASFFTGDFPARAAFEVSELPLEALIEIEAIASL